MAKRVLIVGGGPAGTIAALALKAKGVEVEIVEIEDSFKAVGIGVNLQNSPLRALNELGLVEEILSLGHPINVVNMLNSDGQPLGPPITPPSLVAGMPAAIAIGRGELAKLFGEKVLAQGIKVKLGHSVTDLTQSDGRVDVTFTDESQETFDLVIGADGVNSKVRQLVFGLDKYTTKYSGQVIWRAAAPLGDVNEYQMFNGRGTKIGLVPISKEKMYVFAVQGSQLEPHKHEAQNPMDSMKQAMKSFGGIIPDLIETLEEPVDIRALKSLMVTEDWYRGRVLLIGDAAHACTPHISYGLGMAVEDGIVLAELFESSHQDWDVALPKFMERRYERCFKVVTASDLLSAWELNPPADRSDYQKLMSQALTELSQPI
jgi:2-polyprenyl-6-methoxyphenol hydroxylase-like FAD-dependent oxidoreductase